MARYSMPFKMRRRSNINIGKVVAKVVTTILILYVGGTIVNELGSIIVNTTGQFYPGLSLIGWTVGAFPNNGSNWCQTCSTGCTYVEAQTTTIGSNCVTNVSGTGILSVVGIIGVASIIMEFVEFRLK